MQGMEEKFKKLEATRKANNMIFDTLAQTGIPRFVFVKKLTDFKDKLQDLSLDDNITNDQFEKLSNLIDQFEKIVDDVFKEGK